MALIFMGALSVFHAAGVRAQSLGNLNSSHTLAVDSDGTVLAWGRNQNGQLGVPGIINSLYPRKVLKGVYNGTTYLGDDANNKIVYAATGNTGGGTGFSYAIGGNGTVYSWGYNGSGQLGDGTLTQRNTPVRVLKGAYNGTTYLGDDANNKITARCDRVNTPCPGSL